MPKIQMAHVISLVVAILLLVPLLVLAYPVAGMVTWYVAKWLHVTSENGYLIIDAVVSFVLLSIFFSVVVNVKKKHAQFVVFFGAASMFIYWGLESGFFFNGLNPTYPVWYEINIAANDLIAAALAVFIRSGITSRSTGRHRRAGAAAR